MSISTERATSPDDVEKVAEMAIEPSYISEIARKLVNNDPEWGGLSHVAAVVRVSFAAVALEENPGTEVLKSDYDSGEYGQAESSPKYSVVGVAGSEDTTEWRDYKLIHSAEMEMEDVRDEYQDLVDPDVTIDEKLDVVKLLSSEGNMVSRQAEEIFIDVLKRQFREYDNIEFADYNDPGIDFYVEDDDQRSYGISCEVSTRYVNPIDHPYVDAKKDKAFERDSDLIIMAPEFTNELLEKYENPDNRDWHADPSKEMVHLHQVPHDSPLMYQPFARQDIQDESPDEGGNPIIVPDGERAREMFSDSGHVGDAYPVVDDDYDDFVDALLSVNRNFKTIPESNYRQQVRESIEPLLLNFIRPYRIEQFLIDTYWDKGLTQSGVGRLLSRDLDESPSGNVSGGTIGDWMGRQKWDIITRGTGTSISGDTGEIWKRMYEGKDPFPRPFTGYRIQAEYNRFPHWDLEDWNEWYEETTEQERRDMMREDDSYRNNITYTIMTDNSERLLPSYSLILRRLKDMGVEVRPPDEGPQGSYNAFGDARTLEWMVNRNERAVSYIEDKADRVDQSSIHAFDSYLEVDVANWFSDNEIPYAHEPFTIPSMYGAGRQEFLDMVETIRAIGRGEDESFQGISGFEIQNMWLEIYQKHDLDRLPNSPPPLDSLKQFQQQYLVPDFVLYRDFDENIAPEQWDGWDTWTEIIEVGGLWGVELPSDADEEEWWQWYRVSSVAFKELMYKILGLWDDVYFVIPLQPDIEGESQPTPRELRNDPNYIVFNTTQSKIDLKDLAHELGVNKETADHNLTPFITPTEYRRSFGEGEVNPVEYDYDGIDMTALGRNERLFPISDEMAVYSGDIGELYITDDGVQVDESQWKDESLILLREYVAESLTILSENGIIEGYSEV